MSTAGRLIRWFPLLLPAYILRLKFGPLPTTALEVAFLALAAFATWKGGWQIWRDGLEKTKPWHVASALWICTTAIAIFVAPDRLAALGLWRAYVLEPMAFVLLLAASLKTEKDRQDVVCALIVSALFVALYSVVQFATGAGIPHPWNTDILTRRATGPFPFPNALSLYCAPIAALCFGQIVMQHSTRFVWLGFIAGTLATLLARSVGGTIGIVAAVCIALLWQKKARMPLLAGTLLISLTILAIPALRTQVVSTLSFKQWSGKVRTIIWKETIEMLKDRPVFGAGFGAYPDVIKPYHKATFIEIFQYPHNIFLNLWSETGLLGIVAFGWICWIWVRHRTTLYALLPLIAIFIHGLVDVPYFKNDLAFQFWILALLSTILLPRIDRGIEELGEEMSRVREQF